MRCHRILFGRRYHPRQSAGLMPSKIVGGEGRRFDLRKPVMRVVTRGWPTAIAACRRALTVAVSATVLAPVTARSAKAQAHYYNLDGGRPTRVEDAVPTERYGLDVHFPALRLERLDNGTYRWRGEPKVSIGVLPMTSLEV